MTMQALRETKQTATIACPSGFTAGGTACGIKSSGADDLALILCPNGATAAAVFTQNLVRAAPITLSQANLAKTGGRANAIIINSGCENAAIGEEGRRLAAAMVNHTSSLVNCPPEQELTNSTG